MRNARYNNAVAFFELLDKHQIVPLPVAAVNDTTKKGTQSVRVQTRRSSRFGKGCGCAGLGVPRRCPDPSDTPITTVSGFLEFCNVGSDAGESATARLHSSLPADRTSFTIPWVPTASKLPLSAPIASYRNTAPCRSAF